MYQQKGEMAALHAAIAIGILIMQDIIAVIFMTASKGTLPSPWALCLLALIPLRPLFGKVLERCGHGELQVMFGLLTPILAYVAFEAVGMKGDLGALIVGVMLASHPLAGDLSKMLFGFKEIFLVTFFLTIGMRGTPTWEIVGVAVVLVLLVPIKSIAFQGILCALKLRARTALFTTLGLSNYSEFGLIVAALGMSLGWISGEWLLIIAIAVAISYVCAAPLSMNSITIYDRLSQFWRRFERPTRLPEEAPVDLKGAQVLFSAWAALAHPLMT